MGRVDVVEHIIAEAVVAFKGECNSVNMILSEIVIFRNARPDEFRQIKLLLKSA